METKDGGVVLNKEQWNLVKHVLHTGECPKNGSCEKFDGDCGKCWISEIENAKSKVKFKFSEVIQYLEKNPTAIFENGTTIIYSKDGIFCSSGKLGNLHSATSITSIWKLKKPTVWVPVSRQNAIDLWLGGRKLKMVVDDGYEYISGNEFNFERTVAGTKYYVREN